jgi:hypothetical protein
MHDYYPIYIVHSHICFAVSIFSIWVDQKRKMSEHKRACKLQYADDTIIFLDHDLEQAKNLKPLLCAFEQLSGLKINFHKSEVFCYGAAREMESFYTSLFGCNSGNNPFGYLGIMMHHRQLLNSEWSKVEEHFQQTLSCWKAKYLSYGDWIC